ncbi:ACT domain-containing protein [Brachybacterium huguangmaarense]
MTSDAVRDLQQLLASMEPALDPEPYAFTTGPALPDCPAVVSVVEAEGVTAVVARANAERLGLAHEYVAARITLTVHSALEAVGLTAAVARALADAGISCNVVAGYFHDHLFVPWERREGAIAALEALTAPESPWPGSRSRGRGTQAAGGGGGVGAPAGGATRG